MKAKNRFLVVCCLISVIQSCTSDYTKNLGNGYFYRFEASDLRDIGCEKPNGAEIPADVISYAYNRDFIIAKQKPKLPQDPLYDKDYVYKNGTDTLYYWIIFKSSHIALGPFDKAEFERERVKNKVPNELQLK